MSTSSTSFYFLTNSDNPQLLVFDVDDDLMSDNDIFQEGDEEDSIDECGITDMRNHFVDAVDAMRPYYPSLCLKDARLQSFQTWPIALEQNVNEMADAGLFYTGYGDQTKCFFCNSTLRNWHKTDSPWEAHARVNKKCQYLLMTKGGKFVESVSEDTKFNNVTNDTDNKHETNISDECKEENNNLEHLCIICCERARNVCLLPCKHVVTCGQCTCSLSKQCCPMCRNKFSQVVEVYLN
ncbi:iap-6 [Matsumuraeses phaseoli granulovirus]|uniref:Iap-6 n=1 Tax=Matsumuraeses phaseoli granulovirus TaxID=2760664 RepID=A0AAE7MLH8_9BBAC|nr:iap-6 [Matsumuraeses phaseoli granulovirus]QOD40048.1 iap-6 [Matsumuraeses phaseoli granulovirus]